MNALALEKYKQGLAAYGRQEFVAAEEAYREALEHQPGWSDCLQAMGMAQMNAGKLKEALETLTEVTRLAPEDPLAFTSLSMCWVRLENIEKAEEAQAKARMLSWKQELKTNPNAPPPDDGPMKVNQ